MDGAAAVDFEGERARAFFYPGFPWEGLSHCASQAPDKLWPHPGPAPPFNLRSLHLAN